LFFGEELLLVGETTGPGEPEDRRLFCSDVIEKDNKRKRNEKKSE